MVLRFSGRLGIKAVFVANRPIPGVEEANACMELCPPSEGAADNRIVELATNRDLVVTRDLPLAERLVEAGVTTLDDRGRVFNAENMRQLRSLRDFTVGLAENGIAVERTPLYGAKQLKTFANSLDKELSRLIRLAAPHQGTDSESA